ncbi:MAG TPA: putative glycolipid-binding domain-containing protein [Acidimicrobiales bacterium]|jgi:uncharacterized protein|nr:putative glycolipid-binding domain-containing protein [Acidimicrobiales bacterium]
MRFRDLPAGAAWRHEVARDGFESVFVRSDGSGYRFDGHTAAVEDGEIWAVRYTIIVDGRWVTRAARISGRSRNGEHDTRLDADGAGNWEIDGSDVPELQGCLDVDLESSACTNTIPVHRLKLRVGQSVEAPAAYVRALDLRVERLEQTYMRVDDDGDRQRYQYRSPAFGFEAQLVYDASGLVLDYPGIASRVQ